MFIAALFTITKTEKLPRCPSMDEWVKNHAFMLSHFSCVWLFVILWTRACQAPLSMGFSRQEYWSGFPCPPPGHLPDPEIEAVSLMFPALAGGFFTTRAAWEAQIKNMEYILYIQWDTTQTWKRGNACHLQQLGWILRRYAKWNKSDRERQILCNFTYMWLPWWIRW